MRTLANFIIVLAALVTITVNVLLLISDDEPSLLIEQNQMIDFNHSKEVDSTISVTATIRNREVRNLHVVELIISNPSEVTFIGKGENSNFFDEKLQLKLDPDIRVEHLDLKDNTIGVGAAYFDHTLEIEFNKLETNGQFTVQIFFTTSVKSYNRFIIQSCSSCQLIEGRIDYLWTGNNDYTPRFFPAGILTNYELVNFSYLLIALLVSMALGVISSVAFGTVKEMRKVKRGVEWKETHDENLKKWLERRGFYGEFMEYYLKNPSKLDKLEYYALEIPYPAPEHYRFVKKPHSIIIIGRVVVLFGALLLAQLLIGSIFILEDYFKSISEIISI